MEHTDPNLEAYIRSMVHTAVESSRLGMAPDPELTTTIATANIMAAIRNYANPAPVSTEKGRHKP